MTDALGRPQGVLVLGGGSEIGLAIAGALVDRGARRLWLAGRHPEAIREAAAPLLARMPGLQLETPRFDAREPTSHAALIEAAFAAGEIDVVVIAFGVLGDQRAYEADPALAADDATTNFVGAVSTGLAAASALAAQGHGTLVVLSSVASVRPRRSMVVYGATKAGLDFFARGLHQALHGTGARVLVVRPGYVRTKMVAGLRSTPLATTPERVADDVLRALDRGQRIVWSPWFMRWAALGLRLAPDALVRAIDRRVRG